MRAIQVSARRETTGKRESAWLQESEQTVLRPGVGNVDS